MFLFRYEKIIEHLVNIHGKRNQGEVASSLLSLSYSFGAIGSSQKALELVNEVKQTRIELLGEDSFDSLIIQEDVAICLRELGSYTKSLELVEFTTSLTLQIFQDCFNYAVSLDRLGECHKYCRNYYKAIEVGKKSLMSFKKAMDKEDTSVVSDFYLGSSSSSNSSNKNASEGRGGVVEEKDNGNDLIEEVENEEEEEEVEEVVDGIQSISLLSNDISYFETNFSTFYQSQRGPILQMAFSYAVLGVIGFLCHFEIYLFFG